MRREEQKLRIWVREADAALERAIATLLRGEGHEVSEGALRPAAEPAPDVLVLGVPAPSDAPSPEVCTLPVVLLTTATPLAELGRWLGSRGRRIVLSKPVRERDLIAAVVRATS